MDAVEAAVSYLARSSDLRYTASPDGASVNTTSSELFCVHDSGRLAFRVSSVFGSSRQNWASDAWPSSLAAKANRSDNLHIRSA